MYAFAYFNIENACPHQQDIRLPLLFCIFSKLFTRTLFNFEFWVSKTNYFNSFKTTKVTEGPKRPLKIKIRCDSQSCFSWQTTATIQKTIFRIRIIKKQIRKNIFRVHKILNLLEKNYGRNPRKKIAQNRMFGIRRSSIVFFSKFSLVRSIP